MRASFRTCLPLVLLALAACSSRTDPPVAEPAVAPATVSAPAPDPGTAVAIAPMDEGECSNEPRVDENDKRPRCGGMGTSHAAPRAYRFVGGSGDPVDQVVCDIGQKFVLDGKLFGVEFSGGADGTYKFVRTPNIPGLSWKAGGRYHIEFADGQDKPGTMTTEGGGTTTAGSTSATTSGGEHFTLTPTEACKQ